MLNPSRYRTYKHIQTHTKQTKPTKPTKPTKQKLTNKNGNYFRLTIYGR